MAHDAWPTDWLRAVLELAVLRVLDTGPTYGYAIAAALEERGLGTIKGGTLYPLLSRIEAAGHVTTHWQAGDGGPGRKYYSLTESGAAHLRDRTARWTAFAHTVTHHLAPAATSEVSR